MAKCEQLGYIGTYAIAVVYRVYLLPRHMHVSKRNI